MHTIVGELRYRHMSKVHKLGKSDTRELPGVENLSICLIRLSNPIPTER
jgi:hypothetical protein